MSADEMRRAITRIAHEICERNKGVEQLAIVGIRSRGDIIGSRIADQIERIENVRIPVGAMDITLYRDDLNLFERKVTVNRTDIPFAIDEMRVVLVDDVLYTGRSVRAALDALMDFGRPDSIQLAVLVDRGHRELPIAADYVGKNIPTSKRETVAVSVSEEDGEDRVAILEESPS
ncbi:bifunctional pyr operon transcriptional regulator/uracil phosphoribosyltransferase PyrR [Candidatus Poribacteria bacterium]|nr:bifunctional pyr operon transcriptional regulator/uracil phosphoribosyltransferase PyrR [Candidatus Poribacteria bacterium]